MISPIEREAMRTIFGYSYANKVKEILASRGLRTRDNTEYKTAMISHVFNGTRENLAIEDAIKTAYNNELEKKGIKKPEAVTSGL